MLPANNSLGTLAKADVLVRAIVDNIIKVNTSIAASSEAPGGCQLVISGTKRVKPYKPNTTEGIPANTFNSRRKPCAHRGGA